MSRRRNLYRTSLPFDKWRAFTVDNAIEQIAAVLSETNEFLSGLPGGADMQEWYPVWGLFRGDRYLERLRAYRTHRGLEGV